jgi:hypothetical protein
MPIGICSKCGHGKDLHENPIDYVYICYGSEENRRNNNPDCKCDLYWNDDDKDSAGFIVDAMRKGITE